MKNTHIQTSVTVLIAALSIFLTFPLMGQQRSNVADGTLDELIRSGVTSNNSPMRLIDAVQYLSGWMLDEDHPYHEVFGLDHASEVDIEALEKFLSCLDTCRVFEHPLPLTLHPQAILDTEHPRFSMVAVANSESLSFGRVGAICSVQDIQDVSRRNHFEVRALNSDLGIDEKLRLEREDLFEIHGSRGDPLYAFVIPTIPTMAEPGRVNAYMVRFVEAVLEKFQDDHSDIPTVRMAVTADLPPTTALSLLSRMLNETEDTPKLIAEQQGHLENMFANSVAMFFGTNQQPWSVDTDLRVSFQPTSETTGVISGNRPIGVNHYSIVQGRLWLEQIEGDQVIARHLSAVFQSEVRRADHFYVMTNTGNLLGGFGVGFVHGGDSTIVAATRR